MKTILWISFYFLTFLALTLGMYLGRDKVMEETANVPVLNYTKYHRDAAMADSAYTERIDSLAVVVEGMFNELTEYVSQLQDKDMKLAQRDFEIAQLKQENKDLLDKLKEQDQKKLAYNREQDEKKLQDLAKMVGSMRNETLAPILANLPDQLVKILYDKANSKNRTKIFNSLPPERAGKILTEIAGSK